jgi:hypothetical protein
MSLDDVVPRVAQERLQRGGITDRKQRDGQQKQRMIGV